MSEQYKSQAVDIPGAISSCLDFVNYVLSSRRAYSQGRTLIRLVAIDYPGVDYNLKAFFESRAVLPWI
jgi:hypothetical protein